MANPRWIVNEDYDGSGNLIFVGWAEPGTTNTEPYWRLAKLTYDGSGNLLTLKFASGNRDFVNIWNNRTGLTYA